MERMFTKWLWRLAAKVIKPYHKLEAGLLYLTKPYINHRSQKFCQYFKDIEQFCMFIGYPKSGHTLISSLLDAHENVIFSNELDVIKFIQAGFNKQQIYYLLLKNSQKQIELGRRWRKYSYFAKGLKSDEYSYKVSHQWQGRFNILKIIGDKKASMTLVRFNLNPRLFRTLQDIIDTNIKFIHVIRNPYDNISSMCKSFNVDIMNSIEFYFFLAEKVKNIKKCIKEDNIIDIKHEFFVDNPVLHLRKLCEFLNIDASTDFIENCASIVFKSPHKTRHDIQWNKKSIDIVKRRLEQFSFLQGYSYG